MSSDPVITLFKTVPWLPISLGTKLNVLAMTYKDIFNLALLNPLISACPTTSPAHYALFMLAFVPQRNLASPKKFSPRLSHGHLSRTIHIPAQMSPLEFL